MRLRSAFCAGADDERRDWQGKRSTVNERRLPLRVVYIHQYFKTPSMAGGTRSYEFARRLVERGHEVHMITSDSDGRFGSRRAWHTTSESGIVVHWARV